MNGREEMIEAMHEMCRLHMLRIGQERGKPVTVVEMLDDERCALCRVAMRQAGDGKVTLITSSTKGEGRS